MPNKAKITMNKKSSNNRLTMERSEFNSDATKLRSDAQYLEPPKYTPNLYIFIVALHKYFQVSE